MKLVRNSNDGYSKTFAELTDIRSRYQTLLKSSSLGIVFADIEGRVTYSNDHFLQYLSASNSELSELNIFSDFFQIKEKPEHSTIVQDLLTGNLDEYITYIKKPDDSAKNIRNTLKICRRDDGSFLTFIAIIQEFAELNTLTKNPLPHLEEVLDDAPLAIGLLNSKDLIIESANKGLLHIWGKTTAVIGKPLIEALPEINDQPFPKLLQNVLETGEAFYGNETPAYLDREKPLVEGFYNFVYYPVKNEEEKATAILVVANEVTEVVRAKNNLARSERRLRELIEYADVAIAVYQGRDLQIELANDAMLRLWGKGPEVRGKYLKDALPELKGQPFLSLLEHVFDTGKAYKASNDVCDLMIDGKLERFYFNFSYKPMFDLEGNVHAILNMAVDVTANIKAAELLEETERRSRMIIDAAELGTYELDYKTGILTFSNRLKQIFGIPDDTEVNHQTLIDAVHPDDQQIRKEAHIRARKTGTFEYVARVIQPDGTIKWIRFTGKVRSDNDAVLSHLYGIAMDVTASKQEEMRKNAFVSMASHELKTPLTTIKGYVQLLKLEAKKNGSDFLNNVLVKTEKQANKMIKLVSDFLDVSKIETNNFILTEESFHISSMVEEVVEEMKMISGYSRFITEYQYEGRVYADREKLSQVLTNFLNNAVKYANAGNIYVTVSQKDEVITVSVRDEGPGIKKEDQQKIFDRYYRVENSNKSHITGFGIGLYISAEIIKMHGGEIGVIAEDGDGAMFYFSIRDKGIE